MIDKLEKLKCCGCHSCFNICPNNSIKMIESDEGFLYPKIDKEKCTNCGMCEKVCPAMQNINNKNKIKAFACINKDENIRMKSSSGGIFSLLAELIIKKEGIVFGAKFDDKFNITHDSIDNINDIEKLRRSKYVQSTIGTTYKKVKEFLNNERYVLFTGTPCQIEGLKAYLKKDYEKLYTQDIICHGVPSPKVWRKYLEYRKDQDLENPVQINFRQKDDGWNLFALLLQYNNDAYRTNHRDDLFMKAFLGDVSLRDSCYNCSFKKKSRNSDITLADFWGIDKVLPEMNDNKGTSLVIINSDKGRKLFDNIKDNIEYKEVNFEESIKYNKAMIESACVNKNREKFFNNLDEMEFDKLVRKYAYKGSKIKILYKKVRNKIKNIIVR